MATRNVLVEGLSRFPFIDVVGSAPDPIIAKGEISRLKPDVLTLDVEMPRMDGYTFLKNLMGKNPMPVIMVSALTRSGCELTLNCLEAGAIDFVTKSAIGDTGVDRMIQDLAEKIKFAAKIKVRLKGVPVEEGPPPLSVSSKADLDSSIIAIGASTGGTEALRNILERLPSRCPGMVVVQHMPEKFTQTFAQRLNKVCALEVREARNGDRIFPGQVLIAPGNYHMVLDKDGIGYSVKIHQDHPINSHRPSVDVLFESVARHAGPRSVGVILTGMGRDGAQGLLTMKEKGARTVAQDEQSSVVFGMPKEAIRIGAVEMIVPLHHIPEAIFNLLTPR